MTKTSTSKTEREISLSEFRSWLEGVEAVSGKAWAPTKSQWKVIRKKIDQIADHPEPVQASVNPVVYIPPSALEEHQVTRFPANQASVIAAAKARRAPTIKPEVDMTPEAERIIERQNLVVKVPVDGPYETPFT